MSSAAETFARDIAALGIGPASIPHLTVRRAGCYHKLGRVYSTSAGLVLVGRYRSPVSVTADRAQTMRGYVLALLDEPHRPETYGCQDGTGLFPLKAIHEAARATHRSRDFLVKDDWQYS